MSHDNRFPKTNYLKTNLLKQIKKISLPSLRMILKTYHNSQRAVACNMFNLKNLIKIVSRLSQLSVKQSTLKPNN